MYIYDKQGGIKCATDEPGSSIAKDLIDSEDPKHTLFCRDLRAFSGVTRPSKQCGFCNYLLD